MINATSVERGGATFDAVHSIAFREKKFGEIPAVLPRDAGYKRNFIIHCSISY
jgi:hypothetical protein